MAIERLLRALEEYFVGGIKTNLDLFRKILRSEEFRSAQIDTGWLDRWLIGKPKAADGKVDADAARVAAIAAAWFAWSGGDGAPNGAANNLAVNSSSGDSAWKRTARSEALRGVGE
jgi:acetyl-CoA carboxylase, biotin carboxylase subunit